MLFSCGLGAGFWQLFDTLSAKSGLWASSVVAQQHLLVPWWWGEAHTFPVPFLVVGQFFKRILFIKDRFGAGIHHSRPTFSHKRTDGEQGSGTADQAHTLPYVRKNPGLKLCSQPAGRRPHKYRSSEGLCLSISVSPSPLKFYLSFLSNQKKKRVGWGMAARSGEYIVQAPSPSESPGYSEKKAERRKIKREKRGQAVAHLL